VLIEVDSYYLPDTAGTAYKLAHVKTTIAVVEIDMEAKRLGYFHNQGYFQLEGDDFLDVLRLREPQDASMLPPYAEFVKISNAADADSRAVVEKSLRLLKKHLQLVPATNPFVAFRQRFEQDLGTLLNESLETFHQYSFATLRQYGACYELAATYLQWLAQNGEEGLEEPTRALLEISEGAKAFQFQLARAMSRKKPLDLTPLDVMGQRWEQAIGALKARYG
jgi:hypothetical protein